MSITFPLRVVIDSPVDLLECGKPFGETRMGDAHLQVRLHSQCGDGHVIKYEYWHWGHTRYRWQGSERMIWALLRYFPRMLPILLRQVKKKPSRRLISEGNVADCPSDKLSEHATFNIFS